MRKPFLQILWGVYSPALILKNETNKFTFSFTISSILSLNFFHKISGLRANGEFKLGIKGVKAGFSFFSVAKLVKVEFYIHKKKSLFYSKKFVLRCAEKIIKWRGKKLDRELDEFKTSIYYP